MTDQVETALNSLDGIRRADPGPWFLGRVNNRIAGQRRTMWSSLGGFLSRPSVAFSGIFAILVLNVVLLLNERKESVVATRAPQAIVSDNEYITASNSSFDYENLVQP